MKRSFFSIMLVFSLIALVVAACSLPHNTGLSAQEMASTAVAATIQALTPATVPASLPESTIPASSAPTVAPSAPLRVSFVPSSRNLYVWDEGMSAPQALTSSGDVVESYVSQDGNLIAFTRSADYSAYQIDVIGADGKNQRTLLTATQMTLLPRPEGSLGLLPYHVSWIPGSHKLALSFQATFEGPGLAISDSLYTLDADTGVLTPFLNVGQAWDFFFSPDGSHLIITRPQAVDLYNSDGGLIQAGIITHEFVNTASEYAWVASPVWKADGTEFAVEIAPAQPWGDNPGPSTFYQGTSSGSVHQTYSAVIGYSLQSNSFAPTLTWMAFTTVVGAPADNNYALHVSRLDGTQDTVVDTGNFATLPAWSADGSHFIYYAKRAGASSQVYLSGPGVAPEILPQVVSPTDIRWIDDNRYLVSTGAAGSGSLMLGTVGSGLGVIYNDSPTADGQKLTFDVNR